MSVIVNISLFPVDKGESLSEYVAHALRVIRESGLPFIEGPMGTSVEGEWDEVNRVVSGCFHAVEAVSSRVYMVTTYDYREGKSGRLQQKMDSVASRLKEQNIP